MYKGFFDSPGNVSDQMNLMGMISGVAFPRFLLITAHYAGKLIRLRKGGHIRWLTLSGLVFSSIIFAVIALSSLVGRFNFRTEEVTIKFKDLPPGLNGLRIVHLSDMHLSGFYRHAGKLEKVIEKVNSLHPDLIINTGDFVSFGWREFDRFDTILSRAESRFGSYAILGNHDVGTYLPGASEADKKETIMKTSGLIVSSGYHLLKDEHFITDINGVRIAFIGVLTGGRHPYLTHGNLGKAIAGVDSVNFKILLAHDPNQWEEEVTGKTDIDLTFSGHTHGMQMGIITKKFRWSPSKYFYPNWNGLFLHGNQALYVNRGLGVLAIPFRIWMPPEITVITLSAD
jgi:predicted MPP superfamily phosphohydrolase